MFVKSYSLNLKCMFYSVAVTYSLVVCLLIRYDTSVVESDTRSVSATMPAIFSADKSSKVAALRKSTQLNPAGEQGPQPNNITTIPLYSESVINPHPFPFTIANPGACLAENGTDDQREVFLVILVKCRPNETLDRQQIRQTWGGVGTVLDQRTKTMFLLGRTLNATTNQRLEAEDDKHRDLIQEDFIDSYGNMTFKSTMGLRWVSLFCPRVSYVLSIDSDMTLNIFNLVQRLIDMPRTGFAEGNLRTDPLPHRHRSSKWYTPLSMYPEPTYAPFLNGACYAMSADVAVAVFRESAHVRFLPWDDVFIGLVLKKIGVQPRLSTLYEQFLSTRLALKQGIAKGIRHNLRHVNAYVIRVWEDEVGKRLRNEASVSPLTLVLLVSTFCLLLLALFGCTIYLILNPLAEDKSESFQV